MRVALAAEVITNWQDHLEAILGSQDPGPDKAVQMLELFPRLPQEAQLEVAQYASNLLPDTNYAAVGLYLTNPVVPGPVLEVLLAGLLQRPDSVKLPYLLAVARDEQNPEAQQARSYLRTFLEQDFGQDWGRWQARVDQWVKANPD